MLLLLWTLRFDEIQFIALFYYFNTMIAKCLWVRELHAIETDKGRQNETIEIQYKPFCYFPFF